MPPENQPSLLGHTTSARDVAQIALSRAVESLAHIAGASISLEDADLFRLYVSQADEAITRADSGLPAAVISQNSGGSE
jgi:hypothetical protein